MATASYTWSNWATPAQENLVDGGQSANTTYSKDTTDVAAKFVKTTKNNVSSEFAQCATNTATFETIFGIPAGSTVTAYQVTAWSRKLVSNSLLTAISFNIGLTSSDKLHWISSLTTNTGSVSSGGTSTSTDASYTAQTAGGSRTIDATYQPSNTVIGLEIDISTTTSNASGSANVDARITPITITITYTAPSFNVGRAKGSTGGVLGTGVF